MGAHLLVNAPVADESCCAGGVHRAATRAKAYEGATGPTRCSAIGNAIAPAAAKKAFELMARNLLDETERVPVLDELARRQSNARRGTTLLDATSLS